MGEDHPLAKLTEEVVRKIWGIRTATRWGSTRISRELSLVRSTVEGIIRGKNWRHLIPKTQT